MHEPKKDVDVFHIVRLAHFDQRFSGKKSSSSFHIDAFLKQFGYLAIGAG
jgi:hypothetical protein